MHTKQVQNVHSLVKECAYETGIWYFQFSLININYLFYEILGVYGYERYESHLSNRDQKEAIYG